MKTNKIYGVSSKLYANNWEHDLFIFDTAEDAQEWLNIDQYHLGEQPLATVSKLITREQAVELLGINEVEYQEQFTCLLIA